VSRAFLARARERFAAFPFVHYALLDVEREPASQGFAAGSFDVVVATNVVHATRNVDATLRRLAELLVPGGLLVLCEATAHLPWFDVSTGLIEGWQRFEDEHRRDNPLMVPQQWETALRATGFGDVLAVPESGSAAEILGQHVIVARAIEGGGARAASVEIGVVDASSAASGAQPAYGEDVVARLREALPAERHQVLVEFVARHVAAVLRLDDAGAVGSRERLMDLGLDSLMAVELRTRLALGLGLSSGLPATLVFDHPTADAIARFLLPAAVVEAPPPAAAPVEAAAPAATVEGLSDDEVMDLLLKKLESLERS
jgi:hypothetical protein